ncbi:MAG: hypothetical protein ACOVOV_02540 [Dolichospermum sp.]
MVRTQIDIATLSQDDLHDTILYYEKQIVEWIRFLEQTQEFKALAQTNIKELREKVKALKSLIQKN